MYSSRYIWLQMCSTQGAIPVSSAVYRTQWIIVLQENLCLITETILILTL
jgi:hypothetical protein